MPSWKKVITSGSDAELNSLYAPSITGSLHGTASNAVTASYVNPLQQTVLVTGSLIISSSNNTNDFQVGSNKLFVSSSGQVGIGTTTPGEKLEVSGKTKTTEFQMTTTPTAGYVLTSDASGNGTWTAAGGGGLTNFTEAENTAAPNATVPVNSLTATGAATNIDAAIVPKGTGAFILAVPDNTAAGGAKRGAGAIDLQITRGYFARVASGTNSVAIGRDNTASATDSVAIGHESNAIGTKSFAFGQATASSQLALGLGKSSVASGYGSTSVGNNNIASGQESTAIGGYGNTASNTYSLAIGRANISSGVGSVGIGFNSNTYGRYGAMTWAGGSSTAQVTQMIYRGNTTNDTLTSLNAQEYYDNANNTFSLQDQSAYRFKGTIIGKQSGSTNVAAWDIDGLIVRGANAASTTLNISNVTLVENTPGWGTPVLSASTSFGSLKVQVQGAAATNIRWCVLIEGTEVIYA
jgi:hypothetical protein